MLDKNEKIIMVFASTHQVMAAEEILEEAEIDFDVVPAPEKFSSGCGIALEFITSLKDNVEKLLKGKVNYQGFYQTD
jgi:hypothetical protein